MSKTKSNKQTKKKISVSKHDFYFETSLYEELKYSDIDNSSKLLAGDIDAYSALNKTETTYEVEASWIERFDRKEVSQSSGNIGFLHRGFQLVTLQCKRKENDTLWFIVYHDQINKKIIKIGQFPSIADLQFSDIERKYNKVLAKKYLSEFKKAIVSASHGYGVAAFVYLRRIFENLILEVFKSNKESLEIELAEFKSMRMEDKISLLKKQLPSQLLKMKSIYGILSKGLHELEEDTCLSYFGPLKLSIELILDQKIEEDTKKKRDDEVKKQIQQITSELKQNEK